MENGQHVDIVVGICYKHNRLIIARAYFYNGVFISYANGGVGYCEKCEKEQENT